MLPIECKIPYSLETKQRLLRLCVPLMRELGDAASSCPAGNSWELGGPAERAASAIKVAEWVEWTFIGYAGEHRPVISAPPDELLAALDHLEVSSTAISMTSASSRRVAATRAAATTPSR